MHFLFLNYSADNLLGLDSWEYALYLFSLSFAIEGQSFLMFLPSLSLMRLLRTRQGESFKHGVANPTFTE